MFPKTKYGNKKTRHSSGYLFDSRLESDVYAFIVLLEKCKKLKDIKVKPNIFLTEARIRMIPDFAAAECESGKLIYIEAKGFETEVYLLKRKLWKFYGPGELHVYKRRGKAELTLAEIIIPEHHQLKLPQMTKPD